MHDLQIKSVTILNSLSKWFTINGLSLNLDKTKLMKFDSNHLKMHHSNPGIKIRL